MEEAHQEKIQMSQTIRLRKVEATDNGETFEDHTGSRIIMDMKHPLAQIYNGCSKNQEVFLCFLRMKYHVWKEIYDG